MSVGDVHVSIVEGKFDHAKLATGVGKVEPVLVTVGRMEPGSVTDIVLATVEVVLDEGAVVDVSDCELELLMGRTERGRVGEEIVVEFDPIGGKRLPGRLTGLRSTDVSAMADGDQRAPQDEDESKSR